MALHRYKTFVAAFPAVLGAAVLALGFSPPLANASPVTWTLNNVIGKNTELGFAFDASGSFKYDAETNTYSDFSLRSANISALFDDGDANGLTFSTGTFSRNHHFSFGAPLTNEGGSVAITGTAELNFTYGYSGSIVGVPATASQVPEPASIGLAGLALATLLCQRRARRQPRQ